ncbi:MAG: protein-arginine deiminase family protein [Myxococcota bacterium]
MACDTDQIPDTVEDVERGTAGKAEAPGSCQPADCGGRASIGSCWCDAECTGFGDCCSDKAAVCDGDVPEPAATGPVGGDPDWSFAGVWGVPNLDDDDQGGTTDWQQYPFGADDDFSSVDLGAAVAAMNDGERIQLQLTGDTGSIRVWQGGQPIVGSAAQANTAVFEPSAGEELDVEFGDYNAMGTLTISRVVGTTIVAQDSVELRSAPLVINHHLQPSEHVWAVAVNAPDYNNSQMIGTYASVLGSDFTAVPGPSYGWDVWMQDEFEFGTVVGDEGQRMDVVIDSIRDRGLDPYAEDALVGPSFIADTWGQPWQATSFDSFGNLEASPPVTVGGVDFPLGRIYYGRRGANGVNPELRSFLAAQDVQAPFELPTDWLCVGHVDEFSSFVPDPSSPKGFRLLLADVDAGLDLLGALPSNTPLPRYGADHGYPTVGSLRNDAGLRALNEDIRDDYLLPIRARFMAELGLTSADIIEVPSLFEHMGGCGAASLVPGMVNLIVADGTDGDTHLFIPDPFFRSNTGNQNGDPFIAAFAEALPSSLDLHFVDNWDVYHLGIGEVHCGTNVSRTPTDAWWNATDLLQ